MILNGIIRRSTLDFHAPIARSLGYDVLDPNPNASWAEIFWCVTGERYGFSMGEKVVDMGCGVVVQSLRGVLALRID